MDARAKTVAEILVSPDQYLIPFFQRFYSWKPKQWDRLRNDISALMEGDDQSRHFLGPLVCTPTKHVPSEVPAYQLIDGQQRLTTLAVALAALRDAAKERGLLRLAEQITNQYLVNPYKEGLQRYKVLPRVGDREALVAIIEGDKATDFPDSHVDEAWRFFHGVFVRWSLLQPQKTLEQLFRVLTDRLSLVVITIDGENPYEIFESLNSTGLPLEEADLIRNYLFMQVPLTEQDKFYQQHWQAFEALFDRQADHPEISATPFYRSYLMRTGNYSKAGSTFVDFKAQNKESHLSPAEQVAELRRFVGYELLLQRPNTCKSEPLRRALEEIQSLEVTTAHPLVMNLMERRAQEQLDEPTLTACLNDLASFVIRRSICGESTRTYGRWFPEAIRAIKDNPRDDLQRYWLKRGWPDDATFRSRVVDFALYRRELKKGRVILEALERSFEHKEPVDLSKLTVEHVMPQAIENDARGKAWQAMLGEGWRDAHERWLHTLGNLTLTGYNSDMSNRPYCEKRAALEKSHVMLNAHFMTENVWNAAAIEARGKILADKIVKLWPRPIGDYIPAGEDEHGIRPGPERRHTFWTKFAELLKARDVQIMPEEITGKMTLYFGCNVPGVKSWLHYARPNHEMRVGFTFRRKKGREMYDRLKHEAAIMEGEMGAPLRWTESAAPSVYAYLPDFDLKDVAQWSAQQMWMADRLKDIRQAVLPRLLKMAQDLPDSAITDTKERQLAFWTAFRDFMVVRQSPLHPQKPSPQHWIAMSIGFGGISLSAIASTWDSEAQTYDSNEIRAELVLQGKRARARFAQLALHRAAIEQEFGEPLIWYEPEQAMNCRIFLRRSANLADRDQWPIYFAWLADKLEAMQKVFTPRLEALQEVASETPL